MIAVIRACRVLRRGETKSHSGAATTSRTPRAVLLVLATMSPRLGSRPGIHCCRNSTVKESTAPAAMTRMGFTPARVSATPSGMKRMRLAISSARAALPKVR